MTDLTNRWYQTVRRPSESEEERDNLCNSGDDLYDDDYDDETFDENKNSRYFIDVGDEDDGIFADVEEGSVGHGHKHQRQHHHRHQKNDVISEKQLLCGSTKKHLYKKESSSVRSSRSTGSHRKSNQKLFQKSKLMLINNQKRNNHGYHDDEQSDNGTFVNGSILT